MDKKLDAQKAYFEQLFRNSPQAIVIVNMNDIIIDANSGFEKLFQYSVDEAKGKEINCIAVPDGFTDEATGISEATIQGESVYKETVRKRKDGILIDVAIYTTPINLINNKTGVYCIYNDITDRVVAEAALTRSEARFRKIIEGSLDVIYEMDNRGRVTYSSPTIKNLTSYTPEEILGEKITSFIPGTNISKRERIKIYKILIQGKNLEGYQITFYKRGSNKPRIVEINASPIMEKGVVTGSRGIIRDITGRKETEKLLKKQKMELEATNKKLESANRELESFSYSISHDLRAPVRHIAGFVSLLRKQIETSADEKCLRYINLIAESADRMGTLIDDLLAFSRMGRADLRKLDVDLSELIGEVIKQLQPEMDKRNIEWNIQTLPIIQCDPTLIHQVFQNLISNAIKYTRPRKTARIEIGAKPLSNNEYVFYINDNGVGFDNKYVHKLFGVFQRLHSNEEFEGTGIGLAIVQRIVRRHGGKVWAEGNPGKGSTFYLSLPAKDKKEIK